MQKYPHWGSYLNLYLSGIFPQSSTAFTLHYIISCDKYFLKPIYPLHAFIYHFINIGWHFSLQENVYWTSLRAPYNSPLTFLGPCMMRTSSASLRLDRSPNTAQTQPAYAQPSGAPAPRAECQCAKPGTSLGQTAPAVKKGNGVSTASVRTRQT